MTVPFPTTSRSLDEIGQTLAGLALHDALTDDERGAASEALDFISWLEQAGAHEVALP